MTDERERAAHYEAHKDDADEWGDAAPSAGPRRRLASMFSVRLAPAEAAIVRQAAESRGMSVSAFLRSAALLEATDGHRTSTRPMTSSGATLAITFVAGLEGADMAPIGGTSRPQFTSTWDVVPA
jgi:hypothetical protein